MANASAEQRLIGQRLLTASYFSLEGARNATKLVITDPAPTNGLKVDGDLRDEALREPLLWLDLARSLANAGYYQTASIVQTFGFSVLQPLFPSFSIAESIAIDRLSTQTIENGKLWTGQEVVVPLSAPIFFNGAMYHSVHIMFGVAKSLIEKLAHIRDENFDILSFYREALSRSDNADSHRSPTSAKLDRFGLSKSTVTLLPHAS